MAGNRDRPRLGRVAVLAVAADLAIELPAVVLQGTDHVSNLHLTQLGRGVEVSADVPTPRSGPASNISNDGRPPTDPPDGNSSKECWRKSSERMTCRRATTVVTWWDYRLAASLAACRFTASVSTGRRRYALSYGMVSLSATICQLISSCERWLGLVPE